MQRPSDSVSRKAASSAKRIGSCSGASARPKPIVIRDVAWTIAAMYGATDPTKRAGWKWCSLTHTWSSPTDSAWTTWAIDSRSVAP